MVVIIIEDYKHLEIDMMRSLLKNRYSHVHDALQYLMMGAGEGRTILAGKTK